MAQLWLLSLPLSLQLFFLYVAPLFFTFSLPLLVVHCFLSIATAALTTWRFICGSIDSHTERHKPSNAKTKVVFRVEQEKRGKMVDRGREGSEEPPLWLLSAVVLIVSWSVSFSLSFQSLSHFFFLNLSPAILSKANLWHFHLLLQPTHLSSIWVFPQTVFHMKCNCNCNFSFSFNFNLSVVNEKSKDILSMSCVLCVLCSLFVAWTFVCGIV